MRGDGPLIDATCHRGSRDGGVAHSPRIRVGSFPVRGCDPGAAGATSVGYLNVSLIRVAATEPKDRIGSLLVNPGGPGGSGVEFVRQAGESGLLPAGLRKRFDIVGFDPRGVNASTEIR